MRKFLVCVLAITGLIEMSCISFGWPQETVGLAEQVHGAPVPSFTIAVLRRDGVIVPIVSYGVGGWVNRWPDPGRRQDIPITLNDSPKGWWANRRPIAEWTAWPIRGESRTIHVKNPVNLIVECQPHIGLETDYRSAEPPEPPKIQPFPKDGLATAGNVKIEPVSLLGAGSPEWAAVSTAVAAAVASVEAPLLKDSNLQSVITARAMAATDFSLEVLFASPDVKPGGTVLYFEGVKRYVARAGLPPGGLITYAVGFARINPSAPPDVKVSATLSDVRRQGLLYSLILGSFHVGGRLFWVVQRSTWGFERFDVIEVRQDEILTIFKTPGGVCE